MFVAERDLLHAAVAEQDLARSVSVASEALDIAERRQARFLVGPFIRGRDNSWSQDEALALMLLLDRFVPDWQGEMLSALMPSPLDMLREAIQEARESLLNRNHTL